MTFVKALAVLWGLVYFALGYLKAFTLNSVDFWTSTVLFFSLFLLPLPIVIAAVWLQRPAGFALVFCAVVSLGAALVAAATRASTSSSDKVTFLASITMWLIPHLVFALVYLLAGRTGDQSAVAL